MYYSIQRYKFESNSQQVWGTMVPRAVVLLDTKIQIWKQFTTWRWIHQSRHRLYYSIQRYKFESNSQQLSTWWLSQLGCITRYKDTNLKAIHNSISEIASARGVVLLDTKIQIWKQFTTVAWCAASMQWLYYSIQRYKFESNSQLVSRTVQALRGCITRYKDTNLKAIHNVHCRPFARVTVVLLDTKIQIWKQFTTLGQ